jgi:hypothetical protein
VTSQPQPDPSEGRPAGDFLRPLRDIAAYVLLGATALLLFVAVIRLIPSAEGLSFSTRAQASFYQLVSLETILFPVAAVLLALYVTPRHPNARLITIVALAEYAVAGFFGVIFGFLVACANFLSSDLRVAFEELLTRGSLLAVLGLAGYATFLIWRHLYYVPKPKAQPGVYGQPQYAPGQYGGQPPYGQSQYGQSQHGQSQHGQSQHGQSPYGQPQYGQPGYPPPGYASAGQPAYGPPAYPGMPPGTPPPPGLWGQPQSAPPASYGSAYPPPGHGGYVDPTPQPAAGSPDAGATQLVPPRSTVPPPDATQVMPEPHADATQLVPPHESSPPERSPRESSPPESQHENPRVIDPEAPR